MASRNEKDRTKQIQDKCQTILNQLLKDEDNKYCVDCDAKGPRWASWNLGIFLCIRCAGIHRNLGVHISKVKSVNLDSWTPEQVVTLQQMGNSRARAVYEANLPDSFRRPQTDSALEAFVRAKYEHRKYVAREWVPPSPPKVNWDKEIDDEIERQKKKKKSSSSGATTLGSGSLSSPADKKGSKSSEVVPQLLPKPKSSASPKPGRTTPKRESGGTADLLGTSSVTSTSADSKAVPSAADDVFSSFLSAPHNPANNNKTNQPENKTMDLKTEEESFFNQPAPSEKEKSKMTKDSILALYGQAPAVPNLTNPQFPSNAQNGGFNATFPQNSMFIQQQFQQQQQQSNAFGQSAFNNGFPAQSAFVQNGTSQQNTQQNSFPCNFNNQFAAPPAQQNAFSQFPQQFTAQNSFSAPNSFSGQLGNAFSSAPNHFPQAGGQFQASNNGGFMPANSAANGQQSLFNMPTNSIQQQFGSMSLGHQVSQAGSMNNAFPASQNLQGAFPGSAQTNMAANSVWQ